MTSSTELMQMNDKGVLPFKNSSGKWTVIYLSRQVEGVCEASFDSVFEAMKFAKEFVK